MHELDEQDRAAALNRSRLTASHARAAAAHQQRVQQSINDHRILTIDTDRATVLSSMTLDEQVAHSSEMAAIIARNSPPSASQ